MYCEIPCYSQLSKSQAQPQVSRVEVPSSDSPPSFPAVRHKQSKSFSYPPSHPVVNGLRVLAHPRVPFLSKKAQHSLVIFEDSDYIWNWLTQLRRNVPHQNCKPTCRYSCLNFRFGCTGRSMRWQLATPLGYCAMEHDNLPRSRKCVWSSPVRSICKNQF